MNVAQFNNLKLLIFKQTLLFPPLSKTYSQMQTPRIQITVSCFRIRVLENPPKFLDLCSAYRAPAATPSAVWIPRDPERPTGPKKRSEPEPERARVRRRTREKESERSPGGALQPITPAGLLSLRVHTASDCPPPSLSSLPIHTEPLVLLFSRLYLHAAY